MTELKGKWEVNNGTCNEVVKKCSDNQPCMFPYCEHDLKCKQERDDDNLNCLNQYFNYQKQLNDLQLKMDEIRKVQGEIFDNVKTDITSILIGYDFNTTDFEINSNTDGLKIRLYSKLYNDNELITPLNTKMFNILDELIGVDGKMNIAGEKKHAGNNVIIIDLDYIL